MANRRINDASRGRRTVDGAGVHLVRVLDNETVEAFDPFLMLDSFDSRDPKDYIAGFPTHPHRGIETITYLIEGEMEHGDSLGNKGVIRGGESQWMTAGSGILHQEMPKASERMLGLQLWLNLPRKDKMAAPHYRDITAKDIGERQAAFGKVRVVAGEYDGARGIAPPHIQATVMDVSVDAGKTAVIPVKPGDNAFVFLILGGAVIDGENVPEKTAVAFEMEGDAVEVTAPKDAPCRFILCAGPPLREPVAWGGPIVMNTDQELERAFAELRDGTFIRHGAA